MSLGNKGNKKNDKEHSLTNILLITAAINLIKELIDLIKSLIT